MSFWDEYKEIGGSYIKADEKAVIMEQGIPLKVLDVILDEHNQYQGQASPRYVVKVLAPNPETGEEEERLVTFPIGTVESRDRMLSQMIEYMATGEAEEVVVKLEKSGRSILLRQA